MEQSEQLLKTKEPEYSDSSTSLINHLEKFESLLEYFPKFSREEAENYVKDKHFGSFVLRTSSDKKYPLAMTIKIKEGAGAIFKNMRFSNTEADKQILEKRISEAREIQKKNQEKSNDITGQIIQEEFGTDHIKKYPEYNLAGNIIKLESIFDFIIYSNHHNDPSSPFFLRVMEKNKTVILFKFSCNKEDLIRLKKVVENYRSLQVILKSNNEEGNIPKINSIEDIKKSIFYRECFTDSHVDIYFNPRPIDPNDFIIIPSSSDPNAITYITKVKGENDIPTKRHMRLNKDTTTQSFDALINNKLMNITPLVFQNKQEFYGVAPMTAHNPLIFCNAQTTRRKLTIDEIKQLSRFDSNAINTIENSAQCISSMGEKDIAQKQNELHSDSIGSFFINKQINPQGEKQYAIYVKTYNGIVYYSSAPSKLVYTLQTAVTSLSPFVATCNPHK